MLSRSGYHERRASWGSQWGLLGWERGLLVNEVDRTGQAGPYAFFNRDNDALADWVAPDDICEVISIIALYSKSSKQPLRGMTWYRARVRGKRLGTRRSDPTRVRHSSRPRLWANRGVTREKDQQVLYTACPSAVRLGSATSMQYSRVACIQPTQASAVPLQPVLKEAKRQRKHSAQGGVCNNSQRMCSNSRTVGQRISND